MGKKESDGIPITDYERARQKLHDALISAHGCASMDESHPSQTNVHLTHQELDDAIAWNENYRPNDRAPLIEGGRFRSRPPYFSTLFADNCY